MASLPMYDWPELQSATDNLWTRLQEALQERGFDAPVSLNRNSSVLTQWRSDKLLLSQTCGYPLMSCLKGAVTVIGTPHYFADGCEGPNYCSHLVVRKDSELMTPACLAGRRAAINDRASLSGHSAFCTMIAPLAAGRPYFSSVIESGSHRRSIEFVASGQVDAACIDAVCWQHALNFLPEVTALLIPIASSPNMPGLPFITARARTPAETELIQDAVDTVLNAASSRDVCRRLLICGFSRTDETDYHPVTAMHEGVIARGYGQLY
ncbi:MAG: PhnD/SsuA/transferrin family substrate-binding protein [Stappiaceae bacterium]